MSLIFEHAQPLVYEAIELGLKEVLSQSKSGRQLIESANESVEALGPVKLYNWDVSQKGEFDTKVKQVGWQFLLLNEDIPIAVANVITTKNDKICLANIQFGTPASNLLLSLEYIQSNVKEEIKPRVIRIPRYHLTLLWLSGKSPRYIRMKHNLKEAMPEIVSRKSFLRLIYEENFKIDI